MKPFSLLLLSTTLLLSACGDPSISSSKEDKGVSSSGKGGDDVSSLVSEEEHSITVDDSEGKSTSSEADTRVIPDVQSLPIEANNPALQGWQYYIYAGNFFYCHENYQLSAAEGRNKEENAIRFTRSAASGEFIGYTYRFDIQANASYEFSCYVRANLSQPGKIGFGLPKYNAAGTVIANNYDVIDSLVPTSEWQKFSFSFTTVADTASCLLKVFANNGVGDFDITDISITKTGDIKNLFPYSPKAGEREFVGDFTFRGDACYTGITFDDGNKDYYLRFGGKSVGRAISPAIPVYSGKSYQVKLLASSGDISVSLQGGEELISASTDGYFYIPDGVKEVRLILKSSTFACVHKRIEVKRKGATA